MIVPVAIAPPAHIEINARCASRRSSSCSAVVIRRVPVDPTTYTPIAVTLKELDIKAWLHVP